jgi:hypothetical protein
MVKKGKKEEATIEDDKKKEKVVMMACCPEGETQVASQELKDEIFDEIGKRAW